MSEKNESYEEVFKEKNESYGLSYQLYHKTAIDMNKEKTISKESSLSV
jgi:hypothetical protein